MSEKLNTDHALAADLAELADIVRVVAAQVHGFGSVRDRIDQLINKLIYPAHSDGLGTHE